MISSAIQFDEFGKPGEVLSLVDVELPAVSAGEVRVRMLAAPVNPADLNFIQGNYGVRPELPAVSGIEGCGEIVESCAEGLDAGDRVIFVKRVGTWQSEVVCDGSKVLKIPREIDPVQGAMLKVNPLTAWCILQHFADLSEGDWVIQNAANSGVGQCVIQIARELGLKTINVVRREGLEEELKDLGGDEVLLDDGDLVGKVREICGDAMPKLASNAVGGDSALRLMDALCEEGVHVTFGAMSLRSLKVPNKFLIFKRIRLEGLWVTKWIERVGRKELEEVYGRLGGWVAEGKLVQRVDGVYGPDDYGNAIERAEESGRDGKVLFGW